jgi:uncharacterized protein
MATIGRNDPCPCGSGKKYKKCCMVKETAIDLTEFRHNKIEESLRGDILKFSTGVRFKDEILEAFKKCHGDKVDTSLLLNQDPLQNIRFLDWFINSYVHSKENKRIIDMFADLRGRNLDEDHQKLLEEWKASSLGAFEVESTEDGVLKLTDVFGDNTWSIEDQSACDEVEPGEIIVGRITSSWGKKKLTGAPIPLPADKKQKFVDAINAEFEKYRENNPDSDISQFLSENSCLLNSTASDLASE